LLPSGILTYVASYTIDQSSFDSGSILNQINVTASSSIGIVSDNSDNGIDSDGEINNDPTIVNTAEIEVTKIGNTFDANSNGMIDVGDKVIFNITVENTGSITLTTLNLIDSMTDGNNRNINLDTNIELINSSVGSSSNTLIIGGILTYTATYTLDQNSIDSGLISNSIVVTANDVSNTILISDRSDDGDDEDGNDSNDPTVVPLTSVKSIEVIKRAIVTDLNSNTINDAGDRIDYIIEIENLSNVSLNGLIINDVMEDGDNNNLNLDFGPLFASSSMGSLQGSIKPSEIVTYTAQYTITNDDALTGIIRNSVTVIASSPGQNNDVSEVSDDPSTQAINDPTIVQISAPVPELEVTKIANVQDVNLNGFNDVGDIINYTITIENKGSIQLTGLNINDIITDGNGNQINLTTGPIYNSSTHVNQIGLLQPGEIETYSASYQITNGVMASGSINNQITAIASSAGNNNDVSDFSDDGDDTDGNLTNDVTEVELDNIQGDALIEVTKTADVTDNGDGEVGVGDIITYNIYVNNTGDSILSDVNIIDYLSDGQGNILDLSNGPFFTGSNMDSNAGTLLPGETANYIAFYIIKQQSAETGKILNSVIAFANTISSTTISDTSDDGDDLDGNTTDDPTEVFIAPNPGIEVVKTAEVTDNGDQKVGEGDIITYTITVSNTGNITLYEIQIEDILKDGNGNLLSLSNGPFFSGSSMGSNNGIIQPGEAATYIAFYIIETEAALTKGIYNSVIASAISPGNIDGVSDISDDGDDNDGNTLDDPTEILISYSPEIEVTKTAEIQDVNQDGETGPGDIITFTIKVENTGNVVLSNLRIEDYMIDGNGTQLTLTTGPSFIESSLNSSNGTLQVGEIAIYQATYRILESDVNGGLIENSVLAIASSPDQNDDVRDISDNGNDEDNNLVDDPTIVDITYVPPYFEIFNYVTPNDDGLNDYFKIAGIENFPENEVLIYNRWGVLVYQMNNYGNSSNSENVFTGYSDGRITINKGAKLPFGTYFYVISFKGSNPGRKSYSGYLFLGE
jgi:gliding motility-associated-like protein/uncharacterized repeat protein (TIGR01451 family)